jgi:hypothetical protein
MGKKRGRESFHNCFSAFLRGRPRGRKVASSPSFLAVLTTQGAIAVRRAAHNAFAQGVYFRLRLRLVHSLHPVLGQLYRTGTQKLASLEKGSGVFS